MLEDQGVTRDGARWLRRVERATMAALARTGRGHRGRAHPGRARARREAHLRRGQDVGRAGRRLHPRAVPAGDRRPDRARPPARLLALEPVPVGADRRVARGAAAAMDHGAAAADLLGAGSAPSDRDPTDIRWWTGWTARQTNAALEDLDVDGGRARRRRHRLSCWPTTQRPVRAPAVGRVPPEPGPDLMGWKERDWYLGDHGAALFDRNGNAGPTIWADGRVIGGWVQRTDGAIATKLLERVDRATTARVDASAIASPRGWARRVSSPGSGPRSSKELTKEAGRPASPGPAATRRRRTQPPR